MKKVGMAMGAILIAAAILFAGCAPAEQSEAQADFRFCAATWGDTWEEIQAGEPFRDLEAQVSGEDGQIVQISGMQWMGLTVDVGLQFDPADSQTPGLCNVAVRYSPEDAAALLKQLEQQYGARKDRYVDKNGVENPLQPAGWVSGETVEDVLSAEEQQRYTAALSGTDPSRADAVLRSPLVTIQMDETNGLLQFSGASAAAVRQVQAGG